MKQVQTLPRPDFYISSRVAYTACWIGLTSKDCSLMLEVPLLLGHKILNCVEGVPCKPVTNKFFLIDFAEIADCLVDPSDEKSLR